jgi:glycosyltransferase involved in cell wall biosynthesis
VINLGVVSNEVRLDVLNACDCLVLPSEGEAFGIVFLEAWAVGKPVVGPNTPAATSLIQDGRDGWLVPLGDTMSLIWALKRWIDSPSLAQQMGERGREKVLARYTWRHIADVIEGVYVRTLRARQRSAYAQKRALCA